jgi:hypothetical protein
MLVRAVEGDEIEVLEALLWEAVLVAGRVQPQSSAEVLLFGIEPFDVLRAVSPEQGGALLRGALLPVVAIGLRARVE